MGLKKAENQVKILLAETILAMCRNTLNNHAEVNVEGLLGITLDNDEIFLVSINETITNPDVPSKTKTQTIEENNDVGLSETPRKRPKSSGNDESGSDSDSEGTKDSKTKKRRRKRKRRHNSKSSESGSSSESEDNESPSIPQIKTNDENDLSGKVVSISVMQEETSLSNLSENVHVKQERLEEDEEDLVIVKEELSDLAATNNQFLNMQQQFDNSTFPPDFNSSFPSTPQQSISMSSDINHPQPGPSSSNAEDDESQNGGQSFQIDTLKLVRRHLEILEGNRTPDLPDRVRELQVEIAGQVMTLSELSRIWPVIRPQLQLQQNLFAEAANESDYDHTHRHRYKDQNDTDESPFSSSVASLSSHQSPGCTDRRGNAHDYNIQSVSDARGSSAEPELSSHNKSELSSTSQKANDNVDKDTTISLISTIVKGKNTTNGAHPNERGIVISPTSIQTDSSGVISKDAKDFAPEMDPPGRESDGPVSDDFNPFLKEPRSLGYSPCLNLPVHKPESFSRKQVLTAKKGPLLFANAEQSSEILKKGNAVKLLIKGSHTLVMSKRKKSDSSATDSGEDYNTLPNMSQDGSQDGFYEVTSQLDPLPLRKFNKSPLKKKVKPKQIEVAVGKTSGPCASGQSEKISKQKDIALGEMPGPCHGSGQSGKVSNQKDVAVGGNPGSCHGLGLSPKVSNQKDVASGETQGPCGSGQFGKVSNQKYVVLGEILGPCGSGQSGKVSSLNYVASGETLGPCRGSGQSGKFSNQKYIPLDEIPGPCNGSGQSGKVSNQKDVALGETQGPCLASGQSPKVNYQKEVAVARTPGPCHGSGQSGKVSNQKDVALSEVPGPCRGSGQSGKVINQRDIALGKNPGPCHDSRQSPKVNNQKDLGLGENSSPCRSSEESNVSTLTKLDKQMTRREALSILQVDTRVSQKGLRGSLIPCPGAETETTDLTTVIATSYGGVNQPETTSNQTGKCGQSSAPRETSASKDITLETSVSQTGKCGQSSAPHETSSSKDITLETPVSQTSKCGQSSAPHETSTSKDITLDTSVHQTGKCGQTSAPPKTRTNKDITLETSVSQTDKCGQSSGPPKTSSSKDITLETPVSQTSTSKDITLETPVGQTSKCGQSSAPHETSSSKDITLDTSVLQTGKCGQTSAPPQTKNSKNISLQAKGCQTGKCGVSTKQSDQLTLKLIDRKSPSPAEISVSRGFNNIQTSISQTGNIGQSPKKSDWSTLKAQSVHPTVSPQAGHNKNVQMAEIVIPVKMRNSDVVLEGAGMGLGYESQLRSSKQILPSSSSETLNLSVSKSTNYVSDYAKDGSLLPGEHRIAQYTPTISLSQPTSLFDLHNFSKSKSSISPARSPNFGLSKSAESVMTGTHMHSTDRFRSVRVTGEASDDLTIDLRVKSSSGVPLSPEFSQLRSYKMHPQVIKSSLVPKVTITEPSNSSQEDSETLDLSNKQLSKASERSKWVNADCNVTKDKVTPTPPLLTLQESWRTHEQQRSLNVLRTMPSLQYIAPMSPPTHTDMPSNLTSSATSMLQLDPHSSVISDPSSGPSATGTSWSNSPLVSHRTCPFCRKIFASRNAVNIHSVVHTGEKNFVCSICGISFNTKGNMVRHKQRKHNYPKGQDYGNRNQDT